MVVASTTGGGYDLWARLTARYMVKYIPGNPSIVVQNMPGAGNIIGANYVYSVAKPDGLTLGAVNPALYFDQLVGRSEVKFDWAKFNWIGSPEKNDIVHYIRADTPFKTIDDLRNAKEPQKCGSTGTGSTGHYIPRLLEETLGIKTQIVSGYPGAPDIELAIERGEVFCWSPLLATYFGREPYRRWHKSGYVRVMVQTGAKRDPRLKDTPTLNELMQQYKSPEPARRLAKVILTAATLGRPIGTAPGVPARPRQDPARCLCQSPRRSRLARRSRQTRLGSRCHQGRRAASVVERSHHPAQGNHRAHEVGARAGVIKMPKPFKSSKVQGFNRISSDSCSFPTLELLNPLNLELGVRASELSIKARRSRSSSVRRPAAATISGHAYWRCISANISQAIQP